MLKTIETQRMLEAEPEEVGVSSGRLNNISRLVQLYIDEGKLPGAISMVARRGKIVHFETYGEMDAEASRPMEMDTIFRLYSMTKPITSIALMTLYEEAEFQLDDPVSRFIPAFKKVKVFNGGTAKKYKVREPAREITVRDVLMHTSGLSGVGPSPVGKLYAKAGLNTLDLRASSLRVADMVERLIDVPLVCDPGAEWNYGISTDIVGRLCEIISGESLDHFFKERIFDRLGMVDTAFTVPADKVDRFAANYRRGEKREPPCVLIDSPRESSYATARSYFSGAGGLVSTAADYMRFCKMLSNGGELDSERIVGPRTLRLMTMNHLPGGRDLAAMNGAGPSETARDGIGFGLGFAVLLDPTKAQVLGTPGEYYWGGAASTAFFVSPADELVMVFLTQLMPSSSYPIRRELRATVYQALLD